MINIYKCQIIYEIINKKYKIKKYKIYKFEHFRSFFKDFQNCQNFQGFHRFQGKLFFRCKTFKALKVYKRDSLTNSCKIL